MNTSIVIMGIGNLLRSDDGVGVHAARELAQCPPGDACVVDAGTDVLSALPFLESARRVLLLDAVRGGGEPGSIYQLTEGEICPNGDSRPAHAFSLLDARRLLSPGAPWPEIAIMGVEPADLEYGMELSAPVAAALTRVVATARQMVSAWSDTDSRKPETQVPR